MRTRRNFLKHVGAGAACMAMPGLIGQAAEADRPNIVHILIDDLGYADPGFMGERFCETPNIDRFVAEGLQLTNGYAAAPICSASRAAFLTGKSCARLGFEFVTKYANEDYASGWEERFSKRKLTPPIYTLNLPCEEETVAEALKKAGYTTGMTGKWHVSAHQGSYLDWSPTYGPRQQGFDWAGQTFGAHPYGMKKAAQKKFGPYKEGEYPPDELTEGAIDFVRKHREGPFFLFLSHFYVHTPLGTQCKWLLEKYRKKSAGRYDEERILYAAFVETMDHYVGQFLDALDAAGLREKTLVAFTADNGGHPGFAFTAPLRGSKWNLYEGGIRVPTAIRWPGKIAAGRVSDLPVVGTDFMPTYCALAGATPRNTAQLDGKSIASLLRGLSDPRLEERPICWHFPYYHPEKDFDKCPPAIGVEDGYVSQTRPHSALRKGRYKILYFYEEKRVELYDLKSDTAESKNLAESMPEQAAAMEKELLDYLASVHARLPKRH